jgi:hypothetical protein
MKAVVSSTADDLRTVARIHHHGEAEAIKLNVRVCGLSITVTEPARSM